MESKEYFEKVMQDYNQNRKGVACVSIVKMKQSTMTGFLYKKNYPLQEKHQESSQDAFISFTLTIVI